MKQTSTITLLKDSERMLRLAMMVTLLVAGTSKFCSHGNFAAYYLEAFTKPGLRIHLPGIFYSAYLAFIPYFELVLGASFLWTRYKRYFCVAWVAYFISLEIGHYILEEWVEVDLMIPLIILGAIVYVLPAHRSWFRRDEETEA